MGSVRGRGKPSTPGRGDGCSGLSHVGPAGVHQPFSRARRTNIAPYESVFRDRHVIEGCEISGLLMGQSRSTFRNGIDSPRWKSATTSKNCRTTSAWSFITWLCLCEKERDFRDEDDSARQTRAREMERDFLKAHVLSWLRNLAEKSAPRPRCRFTRPSPAWQWNSAKVTWPPWSQ